MLNQQTVEIIKSTVPVLKEHALAITEHFYPLLFNTHPEVIEFFNQTNQGKGTQPKALANAVVAYGANIDELGNLSDAVTKIVQKHCALGILPEHYRKVGGCLLKAICAVLDLPEDHEIVDAWGQAYGQLAQILIDAEEQVYAANAAKEHGWRGQKAFEVVAITDESSVIKSFNLKPADGSGVPSFIAGQFVTLVLEINGEIVRRNYSLSDAPNQDSLRISVKREEKGLVSNFLHDEITVGSQIKLMSPCGDFTLQANDKPVVLLTAGVGITPAISMLNHAADSGKSIQFIHAAINSKVHAFKDHVNAVAAKHSNVLPFYLYSAPTADCQADATGYINQEIMSERLNGNTDVELYILGPTPFMAAALKMAKEMGVPAAQTHYEFFGPQEALAV